MFKSHCLVRQDRDERQLSKREDKSQKKTLMNWTHHTETSDLQRQATEKVFTTLRSDGTRTALGSPELHDQRRDQRQPSEA